MFVYCHSCDSVEEEEERLDFLILVQFFRYHVEGVVGRLQYCWSCMRDEALIHNTSVICVHSEVDVTITPYAGFDSW